LLTTTPVTNIGIAGMKLAGHVHAPATQSDAAVQHVVPHVMVMHTAASGDAAWLPLHAASNETSRTFMRDLR
jgi:hypothetical protein